MSNYPPYPSSYLNCVLDGSNLTSNVKLVIAAILKANLEFEFIAFRGVSGAAISFPVAFALQKDLVCVRKEKAHSDHLIEGGRDIMPGSRFIIIDDLICSGRTIKEILSSIHDRDETACCKAIVLYAPESGTYVTSSHYNEIPLIYT